MKARGAKKSRRPRLPKVGGPRRPRSKLPRRRTLFAGPVARSSTESDDLPLGRRRTRGLGFDLIARRLQRTVIVVPDVPPFKSKIVVARYRSQCNYHRMAGVSHRPCRVAVVVLLAVAAAGLFGAKALNVQAQATNSQLENAKLRQEIRKLQIENDQSNGFVADLLRVGPFITVVVGVLAVLVGARKEIREHRQQQKLDRAQREKELQQRVEQAEVDRKQREEALAQQRAEAQARFDELFAQAVANLGSKSESVQLSGVVILENFLRNGDVTFHDQVYAVVCANLAIEEHSPLVNRFLVRTFEGAVRLSIASHTGEPEQEPLDLANCQMPRINLRGLELDGVDVAFANLRDANLVGAHLKGVKGYEVNLERARLSRADLTEGRLHGVQARQAHFHNSRLISAELRPSNSQHADLRQAEFFGAFLQGAHLDGADLTSAMFNNANLSDTYFPGSVFNDQTLRSILKSARIEGEPSWRKAHFDVDVRAKLERFAAKGRSPSTRAPAKLQGP
jgi:uncharacterized protein YjbI with pentapeptide repeats